MTLAVIIGFFFVFGAILYYIQDRIIYYPRAYDSEFEISRAPVVQVPFATGQGKQLAFYVAPKVGPREPPERLWMMFAGNASLALGWLDLVEKCPEPRTGFLLLDYPGYGRCAGRPSPKTILESSEIALTALAGQLKTKPEDLTRHLRLMGHSLGAAAALQLAARTGAERVVLVSPFTSLADMARRAVGWPLGNLLRHRFNNRARLAELAQPQPRPEVVIIHGDADPIVPVAMGRELAGLYPGWIEYHEIHGADHNFILFSAEPQILAAMFPESRILK